MKFFLDKLFSMNEICVSALDIVSRFILFETAEAEDNISVGIIEILMLFDTICKGKDSV